MLIRSYFIDVDVVDVDVKLFYLSPPKVFVLFVERGFVTLQILYYSALKGSRAATLARFIAVESSR